MAGLPTAKVRVLTGRIARRRMKYHPDTLKPRYNVKVPPTQECPNCGALMLAVAGRKDAICNHCGYKEPCC